MDKILAFLISILTIVDIVLRNSIWSFLTSSRISINFLEIIIIASILILINRWLPNNVNKTRAKRFYKKWQQFKKILLEYKQNSNPEIQKKYGELRKSLLEDFGFFIPIMKRIHEDKNDPYNVGLQNLENCFLVESVDNWFKKVRREIPRELDCFDRFIVSIEGFYNNPKT